MLDKNIRKLEKPGAHSVSSKMEKFKQKKHDQVPRAVAAHNQQSYLNYQ